MYVLAIISPFVLIIIGVLFNRLGISLSQSVLKVLVACLAFFGAISLINLLMILMDWGFWRWRWMNGFPIAFTIILIVMVYSLGKKHFTERQYRLFKSLQLIPIVLAILMLFPFVNLSVLGFLGNYPERYYQDESICIQQEYEGILAMAKPPKLYQFKYGLFIQELLLTENCYAHTEAVEVSRDAANYRVVFKDSNDAEGTSRNPDCVVHFNIDQH